MLTAGDPAPEVSAPNQDGDAVAPDFEHPTVVYFYPRDGTPGCTTEAEQFTQEWDAYEDAGVTVYGVSTDDVDAHREFADDLDLPFELLADPDGAVAEAFGLELNQPRHAAPRTTFVLADGTVQRAYDQVRPDGHARAVLGDMADDGLVSLS